jgi:hypothetical protein
VETFLALFIPSNLRNPLFSHAVIRSIDISDESVRSATAAVTAAGLTNLSQAAQCQVALQAQANGNALIGRELDPLLTSAEYENAQVSPRMVYVNGSRPELVSGFTKNTFTAVIQGVKRPSIAAGLMTEVDFDRGLADLFRTAEPDGEFSYTFCKAVEIKSAERSKRGLVDQPARIEVHRRHR